MLTLGAEIDLASPAGRRTLPLNDLYIGYARHDTASGDGKNYLALKPGEFVTAVRARNTAGLRSAYDKIRIRRSIEYPVAGVAVALRREGEHSGRPARRLHRDQSAARAAAGHRRAVRRPLDEAFFKGLDHLVRDQIMAMKTTFTPGHYRRRVAGVLARRLVERLFAEG